MSLWDLAVATAINYITLGESTFDDPIETEYHDFFRTVWYELLCGEWPFKGQPPEAIIWQVGKGMKQPLANLQASRDVKVGFLI